MSLRVCAHACPLRACAISAFAACHPTADDPTLQTLVPVPTKMHVCSPKAWCENTDGREGEGSVIYEYFDLRYLFVFNIKRANTKNERRGRFELSGWQAFCATAC